MANTTVGIIFEVYNRGTRGLANIERSVSTVGRSLQSLTATALGLAGAGSLTYVLTKTAEGIDRIAKSSDRLGLTTEQLSSLEYAAKQSSVGVEDFDRSLEQMTRRVTEAAHGAGTAGEALAALGLDARELAAQTPEQMLYQLADAMARVPTQAERVRLATKLFKGEQLGMVNLLKQGSDAIRRQQEEATTLGLTFSRIDAAQVEEANDAVARLGAVITGTLRIAVIELSPYVEAMATGLVEATTAGGGFGETVTSAMESVAVAAAKVLELLQKISSLSRTARDLGDVKRVQFDIERQARAQYEFEMKRQGRTPYRSTMFGTRPGQTDEDLYNQILSRTWTANAPLYADRVPESGPQDPVGEIEKFFAGVRARAAEAQQRATIARSTPATPVIAGEGASAADEITRQSAAVEDLLTKLRRENELLGMNAAERQREVILDQVRRVAQDEANRGLRTTADLTAEEVRAVEQLVAKRQQLEQAAAQREFNTELNQTISTMRIETEQAALTTKERERAVVIQNAENEALRRGVELTAAQREELERVVEAMQRARDMADVTFGQGFALGIRNMQEELKTAGQIGYDLSTMLRDGVVGAINDAVFRAEDLGETLEQVGLKMLEYWAQEAMWKPLVTQGMNLGTQLLGSLAGSMAGSAAGGQTSMFGASSVATAIAHTGGVSGRDVFPTRIVPASAFAHAPRFHAGVGPGERAAVIRDEEGVFTPGQMRALGRGLGGDRAAFGEMAGLLGQILAAVRERQTLKATIVDKRQTAQEWFGSREGEQAWKYHAARNG
jgi:hypothetical protein